MDNDSTQPQPQEQEQDQTAELRKQLSEAITAERFFEMDTGRLWTQFATVEINRLIKDITSDKFDKDHQGYINAKIELRCWRKMLSKMQLTALPKRRQKIEERLALHESQ